VHVASFATDESFIDLDLRAFAASFLEGSALHGQADAMHHEPCGFLGNAKSAVNLIAADAILR
jgi:hypothetical protein